MKQPLVELVAEARSASADVLAERLRWQVEHIAGLTEERARLFRAMVELAHEMSAIDDQLSRAHLVEGVLSAELDARQQG